MKHILQKSKSYSKRKEIYMLLFPKVLAIFLLLSAKKDEKEAVMAGKKSPFYLPPKECCALIADELVSPKITLQERIQIGNDLIEDGFYSQFRHENGYNPLNELHSEIKEIFWSHEKFLPKVSKSIEKKEDEFFLTAMRDIFFLKDHGFRVLNAIFRHTMKEVNLDTRKEFGKIAKQMKEMCYAGESKG